MGWVPPPLPPRKAFKSDKEGYEHARKELELGMRGNRQSFSSFIVSALLAFIACFIIGLIAWMVQP